jgi:hypothetical protein
MGKEPWRNASADSVKERIEVHAEEYQRSSDKISVSFDMLSGCSASFQTASNLNIGHDEVVLVDVDDFFWHDHILEEETVDLSVESAQKYLELCSRSVILSTILRCQTSKAFFSSTISP